MVFFSVILSMGRTPNAKVIVKTKADALDYYPTWICQNLQFSQKKTHSWKNDFHFHFGSNMLIHSWIEGDFDVFRHHALLCTRVTWEYALYRFNFESKPIAKFHSTIQIQKFQTAGFSIPFPLYKTMYLCIHWNTMLV